MNEVNQYGDTFDGKNYCVGIFSEPSNEAYWDLRHHNYQPLLLSVSASNQALLWSTNDLNGGQEGLENSNRLINSLKYNSPRSGNRLEVPTSCSWIENSQHSCLVAYQNNSLVHFDSMQSQIIGAFSLQSHINQLQVNKIDCHPTMSLAAAAHESGELSFFDFSAGKLTRTIS